MLTAGLCHEIDHLDGVLFRSLATEILSPEQQLRQQQEENMSEGGPGHEIVFMGTPAFAPLSRNGFIRTGTIFAPL